MHTQALRVPRPARAERVKQSGMATYDEVDRELSRHGFELVGMTDDGDAGYRSRTSPVRYTTAPCGTAGQIPDSIVHRIMRTAGIPYEDYKGIVNSQPDP